MKLYPLSMVGGILGLISLGLPWLAATSTGFFQSSQSVSGFQLLSIQSKLGNTSGPASTALLLMVVGPTAYPAPPAQAPGPYGPPPATASQAPGAPAPAPTFAAVNVLPPTQDATPPVNPPADLPMAAPGTAVANPLFVCPSCGRKGPEAFCTEDGTRMGPSPEIA